MKAVILAAGRGSRIHSVTQGTPKCLLRFGSGAILDFQLEGLALAGITDIAIVIGHQGDRIIRHVAERHPDKMERIEFIRNPRFAYTNNMYSLWLARDWLAGAGFLVLNADVLCHPGVLLPAVQSTAEIFVVVDPEFREETTKVIIRGGRVLALSKSISREDYSGTFVNIAAFSAAGSRALFAKAESLFAQGELNQFFNDVVGYLIREGVRVSYTETSGLPWAEIDDANDLAFARTQVLPLLQSVIPDSPVAREQPVPCAVLAP